MLTEHGAGVWADVVFRKSTPPSGYWIALVLDDVEPGFDGSVLADIEPPLTVEIVDPDTGTETTQNTGYQRVYIPASAANWTAAIDAGFVTNAVELSYPAALEDWGTLTGFAMCSASTGGEVYGAGLFSNPVGAVKGTTVKIPPGGITISFSSATDPIVV